MTLNFPSDPGAQTPVNTYGPDSTPLSTSNNITYVWDGEKWVASTQNSSDARYVNVTGDTMTGDLTVPNLVSQGNVQAVSFNGGPLSGLRNQLINGACNIWQRSLNNKSTNITTTGTYMAIDRWRFLGAGQTITARVARNGNPIADAPAAYSMQIDEMSDVAQVRFAQGIELEKTGNASQFRNGSKWTLSVYCNQDLTTTAPAVGFADNLHRSNVAAITNVDNWERISDTGNRYKCTFTVNVTPNNTNVLFYVFLGLPGGITSINYTCWQLESGPVATPFEHRPIGLELSLCQRYYVKNENDYQSTAKDAYNLNAPSQDFPVPMCKSPNVTVIAANSSNTNQIAEFSAGSDPTYVTDRATAISRAVPTGYTVWSPTGQLTAGAALYRWSYTADAEF